MHILTILRKIRHLDQKTLRLSFKKKTNNFYVMTLIQVQIKKTFENISIVAEFIQVKSLRFLKSFSIEKVTVGVSIANKRVEN